VLAMTLVLTPSKVAGDLDDIRTLAADGAMTGYAVSPRPGSPQPDSRTCR